MSRSPHTTFYRGKRVRVRLKSGEVFEDHFVSKSSRSVQLRERGQVLIKDLAVMSVARGVVK